MLKELINLRLKFSFLSLVQIIPRAQITPFYGTFSLLRFDMADGMVFASARR